jgi:hypothetical protein
LFTFLYQTNQTVLGGVVFPHPNSKTCPGDISAGLSSKLDDPPATPYVAAEAVTVTGSELMKVQDTFDWTVASQSRATQVVSAGVMD